MHSRRRDTIALGEVANPRARDVDAFGSLGGGCKFGPVLPARLIGGPVQQSPWTTGMRVGFVPAGPSRCGR